MNLVNGKIYVGQSVDLYHRRYSHFSGWEANRHLKSSYLLYGLQNFTFEYLKTFTQEEYSADPDCLTFWEAYYVDQFDSRNPDKGYNLREPGPKGKASEETKKLMSKAQLGHSVSEETRQRMREKRIGKSSGMKGKTVTNSAKEKMRDRKLGNTYRRGKQHTEEAKQRMSEAHKGAVPWNKGVTGVIEVSEETREKHRESAKRLGLRPPVRRGPHTEEAKRKMSESKKGKFGHKKTEEEKRKISEAMKRVRAEQKARNEANKEG